MPKVVLILDDTDRHDQGCDCGKCNANGKSYGCGIYPADEGECAEVMERVYGPSEDAALHNARLICQQNNYEIVPDFTD